MRVAMVPGQVFLALVIAAFAALAFASPTLAQEVPINCALCAAATEGQMDQNQLIMACMNGASQTCCTTIMAVGGAWPGGAGPGRRPRVVHDRYIDELIGNCTWIN